MLLRPRTQVVPVDHGGHRLVGDLALPVGEGPHPLVVTVFGSGPGGRHVYDWPQRFTAAGYGFYAYDRPGCGESTGDWREMGFPERADETRAVVAALARRGDVDAGRIALLGGSQGGWIAPLAAAPHEPDAAPHEPAANDVDRSEANHPGGPAPIAAVVTFSGPGVSPAAQERYRIANALRDAGLSADEVDEGMAALCRVQEELRAGRPSGEVLARVRAHAGAAWLPHVLEGEVSEADLDFERRILDYDPIPALRALRCPYLVLFGACDTLVPVDDSVRLIGDALAAAGHADHRIVVFPDADHGIRPVGVPPAADGVPQRAAGFFELIIGWLTRRLGVPPA